MDAAFDAAPIGGVDVRTIHIVGGGALNALLCQRTADRAGLPVAAGLVEATALGNVLVQARTAGFVDGPREALRDLVARTLLPRVHLPRVSAYSAPNSPGRSVMLSKTTVHSPARRSAEVRPA